MKKQIKIKLISALGILFFSSVFYTPATGQTPVQNPLKREIKILKGQTHLNLPVNSSDRMVRATISVDGRPLDLFTINLAEKNPEFWTFFDVSAYQGKTITVEIADAPNRFPGQSTQNASKPAEVPVLNSKGLNKIFADSKFPGQDSLYMEKGRPQVHFSAQRGWINDPNGLVYDEGEYHMYFQHNPYGWQWGNMHWGHAVSNDLIHWQQLKEAIYPVIDKNITGRGDAAFSGSAVVDPENTAGFRKDGIDPIIAIYTSTGRGECLKMSYDKGRSFVDYEGNPILKHNGRDPKVFWYAPGKHWVMVVWESGITKKISLGQEVSLRQHSIYTSPDLKNWTYQSGISGFYECPELFKLPVEGEPGLSKWVMYDANGRYVVGDFNGKKFTIDQDFMRYENGGGYFYASQTFNNSPDGRRIQVGWGRNITNPGMPFNQALLFPSELKLRKTPNGYRLCPTPVREINTLHQNSQVITDKVIQSGQSESIAVKGDNPIHIIAEFERGDAPITLNILGYELRHDNEWIFATTAPDDGKVKTEVPAGPFPPPTASTPVTYVPGSDIFKIEAIVDKNILEFFINDGELYYVTAFNGEKTNKIEALVSGGRGPVGPGFGGGNRKLILKKLEVNELNSIWNKPGFAQQLTPVKVESGLLQGMTENGLSVYRGIPFAEPPVGDLRWRAPQPVAHWEGIRQATRFASGPIQGMKFAFGNSEDCLYLNIWTPAKSASERIPVLVWIHGGGFNMGSASEAMFSGDSLARKGVVLVCISYRVGQLGFLTHPELSAESPNHVSGNYGLLDMIAGLKWVQKNIAAFGGDPEKVTIFGESAGGIAVSMLSASPLAKGLFHGAISQSGGSFGPPRPTLFPGENLKRLPEAERDGVAYVRSAGVSSIAELRKISADKLPPIRGLAWPIIDGWVIPDDQYKLYAAGKYNDTPILVGYNSDEGLSFSPPKTPDDYITGVRARYGKFADDLIKAYPVGPDIVPKTARDLTRDAAFGWHTWIWARLQAQTGKSKVFYYCFDQHPEYPKGSPRTGYGSPHGQDVPFVFMRLDASKPETTKTDLEISTAMATYWTNFAKYGDPNGKGVPVWPTFSDTNPVVMYFSQTPHTGPVPSAESLKVLDAYFAWRRTPEGEAWAK